MKPRAVGAEGVLLIRLFVFLGFSDRGVWSDARKPPWG